MRRWQRLITVGFVISDITATVRNLTDAFLPKSFSFRLIRVCFFTRFINWIPRNMSLPHQCIQTRFQWKFGIRIKSQTRKLVGKPLLVHFMNLSEKLCWTQSFQRSTWRNTLQQHLNNYALQKYGDENRSTIKRLAFAHPLLDKRWCSYVEKTFLRKRSELMLTTGPGAFWRYSSLILQKFFISFLLLCFQKFLSLTLQVCFPLS